jgi:iron-hydrogenase subunit alpha
LPIAAPSKPLLEVSVCVGTNCYLHSSRELLERLVQAIHERGWDDKIAVKGTFCFENCKQSPNVAVGHELIGGATVESVLEEIEKQLAGVLPEQAAVR